jgi:hypothetical protein
MAAWLERHHTVALGKEPRHVGWRHQASVDHKKDVLGRPTGDGAALSDEDRNLVVPELGQELTRRGQAHTLQPVGVVAEQ